MSYIGSTPTTQNFIAGTDSFNGTGSATNFTLSRFVNSTNDIQVVVNNVVQYPPNYSVSGNTLTISPAPSSGTNNVYVRYLSTTLQSITVPGGSTVVGNFGLSGNLQFLGSAQRITGDFTNATIANRAIFQTSTVNGATNIYAIPNGTGTSSAFTVVNNSDPTNAAIGQLAGTSTDIRIQANITGAGSFLPMTFYTGGSERARITTAGLFQFNSGYGSVATAYGCRVWIRFTVTAGTPSIAASGNVTSITDNGNGDFTFNFTSAMPDTNYAFVGLGTGGGANYQIPGGNQGNGTTLSTGSLRTQFGYVSSIGGALTNQDPAAGYIAIFR